MEGFFRNVGSRCIWLFLTLGGPQYAMILIIGTHERVPLILANSHIRCIWVVTTDENRDPKRLSVGSGGTDPKPLLGGSGVLSK